MKWVTRQYLHFDRVATAWLIKRFIDQDAKFLFVRWGHENDRPADAIAFAIPGTRFGPHDAGGSAFRKVAIGYNIDDLTIETIAKIVDTGVNCALHGYRPGSQDKLGQIAVGLLEVSNGMILLDGGDEENLTTSLPIWDALYRVLRTENIIHDRQLLIPSSDGRGPESKIEFLRDLLKTDARTIAAGLAPASLLDSTTGA
jgi:hypothetical protein